MKVLLIDVDGKLPNLALCKISAWHKLHRDEVFLMECENPDKVYISVLFTWNRIKAEKLLQVYPEAEVGGTGWNLHKELPPEIEACKPDYDLYKVIDILPRIAGGIATKASKVKKAKSIVAAGIGFTSRGCVRQCGFCFVPQKEGPLRHVAEIGDLLNTRSNVLILLDNNLTGDPDCIDKLHEIRDRGLVVDITQGIDVRLMTPEIAQALSEVKLLRSLHYAWDLMKSEQQVTEGVKTLAKHVPLYKHMCFMLTGYNTSFEEDMYRFKKIAGYSEISGTCSKHSVDPYVMPYNKQFPTEKHRHFARWVNGRIYKACRFEEYGPWLKAKNDIQLSMV